MKLRQVEAAERAADETPPFDLSSAFEEKLTQLVASDPTIFYYTDEFRFNNKYGNSIFVAQDLGGRLIGAFIEDHNLRYRFTLKDGAVDTIDLRLDHTTLELIELLLDQIHDRGIGRLQQVKAAIDVGLTER